MRNKKENKEWFIDTPWGKLAIVAWGAPAAPPVLLVHGMADSAATFIPLVDLMPDDYYYVTFDLPGNGYSDPMKGLAVSQIHLVESIRLVVDHMKWDSFICIAHSVGYVLSSFYNTFHPGKISKIVGLDPGPPLSFYKAAADPVQWFKHMNLYYRIRLSRSQREYTYQEAVTNIMRALSYTEEQSALMLSRCLKPTTQGKYRFSRDQSVIKVTSLQMPYEMLYETLATEAPTLIIWTSSNNANVTAKSLDILKRLQKEQKNFFILNVEGTHNVHFTHPERVLGDVIEFLKTNFDVKSKL